MRVVNNFSEIKEMPIFINSVSTNPVALEIKAGNDELARVKNNLSSAERAIQDYKNALEEQKRKQLLMNTEVYRIERKLKALEKVASKSTVSGVLETLTAKKFDDFMRPMGLRFFSMHTSSSGEAITFTLVREAKPISYVITPPLVLRIIYSYNRDHSTYHLHSTKAMPLIYFNNINEYVHPHINSGSDTFKSICMGNYLDVLRASKVPSTFSNWQDHVLLLDQLLSTYNPDSPYIGISELASQMRSNGYHINDRDKTGNYVNVDSSSKFIMFAEGLEQMFAYNPENILTQGMFDRFQRQVHALDTKTLLTDLIAKLSMIYFSDEEETWEKVRNFYDEMPLDISGMDDPSDYECGEDGGGYIEEDQFETLKDQWIKAMTMEIPNRKSIAIPKMPKETYEYYFGEQEEEQPSETVTEAVETVVEEAKE